MLRRSRDTQAHLGRGLAGCDLSLTHTSPFLREHQRVHISGVLSPRQQLEALHNRGYLYAHRRPLGGHGWAYHLPSERLPALTSAETPLSMHPCTHHRHVHKPIRSPSPRVSPEAGGPLLPPVSSSPLGAFHHRTNEGFDAE